MKNLLLVLFLLMISSCSLNQAKVQASYDEELQLRGVKTPFLLEESKYKELNNLITKLGNNFLADVSKENTLFLEIDSIVQSKRDYGEKLNEFVSAYPESYVPYYLRSAYLSGVSWNKRGDKFISDTSQNQIDGFIYYKQLAERDINKAIEINNNLSWLYTQKRLILIGQRGNKTKKDDAFRKAFELRPESYMLWNDILHNSTPRWGGSLEEMSRIIESSKEFWELNPRLQSLQASISKELGDQARFSKNISKAESLYIKSLKIGDHARTRLELGSIQMNKGDYKNGCENIYKALDMRPTLWVINQKVLVCKSKDYSYNQL